MKTYPNKIYQENTQGMSNILSNKTINYHTLFKQILVTGIEGLAPTSVSWDGTRSLVKVDFASEHTYKKYQIIECKGVVEDDYKGEHRVMIVEASSLWFELDDGVIPSAPATGITTIDTSPLGWSLLFDGTNKGIFETTKAHNNCERKFQVLAWTRTKLWRG